MDTLFNTMTWTIAFKEGFYGAKNVYVKATDLSGNETDWEQKREIRINNNPMVNSITPNSGTFVANTPYTFNIPCSDLDGHRDIGTLVFDIASTGDSSDHLYVLYYGQDPSDEELELRGGRGGGRGAPGSDRIIECDFGKLYCAESTLSRSGNNLTFNITVSFSADFIGEKSLIVRCDDSDVFDTPKVNLGTITVTLPRPTIQSTYSPAEGGTISPSGEVIVGYGEDQAFTITANTSYEIDDVLVDGVSQGKITSYTFSNTEENHTIGAVFVLSEVPKTPPARPSGFTAEAISPTQIKLTWNDNSDNEDGFKIQRNTSRSGRYTLIATLDANTTEYIDENLEPGQSYYYAMNAYNEIRHADHLGLAGTTTLTLTNTPVAPSNLTGIAIMEDETGFSWTGGPGDSRAIKLGKINLSWTDNSGNELGFKIERSRNYGRRYSEIATVSEGTTSYADENLAYGVYQYRVRAYNVAGDSNFSNVPKVYLVQTPPARPSGLVTEVVSPTQIKLTWNDNSDNEDGFRINRNTSSSGRYTLIATLDANTTEYIDENLEPGQSYYYAMSAYNEVRHADHRGIVSATTPEPQRSSYIRILNSNGSPCSSAKKIDLVERSHGTFVGTITTDANGIATFDDLRDGESYYIYDIESAEAGQRFSAVVIGKLDPPVWEAPFDVEYKLAPESTVTVMTHEGGTPCNNAMAAIFDATNKVPIGRALTAANGIARLDLPASKSCTLRHITYSGEQYVLNKTLATPFTEVVYLNHPPTITLQADKTSIAPGDTITFTGTISDEDNNISTIVLDLGDGDTKTLTESPFTYEYTYQTAGNYEAKVTVTDEGGLSITSATIVITVAPSIAAPADLSATSALDSSNMAFWINLTWQHDGADVDEFKIERKDSEDADFAEILRLPLENLMETKYRQAVYSSGTYEYRVRAYSEELGYSKYSNVATVTTQTGLPPAAPTNLTFTVHSPTSVTLNWVDNADNETGFWIEKAEGAEDFPDRHYSNASIDQTTRACGYLTAGVEYRFRVQARNVFGRSAYSNVVTVNTANTISITAGTGGQIEQGASAVSADTRKGTRLAGDNALVPPATPLDVEASAVEEGVSLTWQDNSHNEKGFRIYRQDGYKRRGRERWGEAILIGRAGANATSYSDTAVEPGAKYRYFIKAYNSAGESQDSNGVDVTAQ